MTARADSPPVMPENAPLLEGEPGEGAAGAPKCPFAHLPHVAKGVRPPPSPPPVVVPGDDLTAPERVLVIEAYNKTLPWRTMVSEAWAQRMCDLDETLFDRMLVDFFPEVEDYLLGLLDIAVRNLNPRTDRVARESYRAMHPDPERRFQTFEEYASAFLAMGFTEHEWRLSKEAFLWVLETHSPYLEGPERQEAAKGAAGAFGRFYQAHVVDRARACEPAVLLSEAEARELKAYWAQCKGARTKFGVVFYRSIFKRHPEVIKYFQETDMDRLSVHLFDAADLAIEAAPDFWAGRHVFRTLGASHACKQIPTSAYPAVNEHVIDTLDHFAPLDAGVRHSLQKAMFLVSFLVMQPAAHNERVEREATQWFEQMAAEKGWPEERLRERLATVRASIQHTGTYDHTSEELAYGAQVAWRNSAKCIGRVSWNLLTVRDRRHVTTAAGMFQECVEHLRLATEKPNMEAVMTVFAPRRPRERWGARFWNHQLVRYAGYREPNGSVVGDPANVHLTERIRSLGWEPPEPKGSFDVLPVVLELPGQSPFLYQFPDESVLQVDLSHPTKPEFSDLRLRWCAVPTITNFNLRLGGVDYVCCPFNGWFMQSEIARNLWERYKVAGAVAGLFGLDTSESGNLWEDHAWNELNAAVLHSFRATKLSMVDHRNACHQFFTHVDRERKEGREVPAQWSWVVPAIGGSTLPLWHHEMRDFELFPQYRYCCERFLFGLKEGEPASGTHFLQGADLEATGEIAPLDVLLLYGSETGTCERYAVDLARRLGPLRPAVMSLDEAAEGGALAGRDVIVVVTSTFGEGKPPSNAVRFDDEPLPALAGAKFAVFAAGSTIYPNYAKFGKKVFARLRDEAGAEPIGDVMLGNELAGQARAFDEFCGLVVGRIAPALAGRPPAAASFEVRPADDPAAFAWPPEDGVGGCRHLPVLENRELLQRGTDRSTRLVRFDLAAGGPGLSYETGDHLKVWPLNEPALVEQMCALLKAAPDEVIDIVDAATGERARVGFPLPNTARNILGTYLDLSLRKESFGRLFPALEAACADPLIRSTLRRWIHDCKSPAGGDEAAAAIASKYVTVAGLLSAFPACKLTLAQAVEVLPKQRPRYYSISSGAAASGSAHADITVSVVAERLEFGAVRRGLCSNYLNSLRPGVDSAWVSVRPSHFRAPADPAAPVLMVGPGTGLAPMMGFLADRARRRRERPGEPLGECHLFFGCRNEADFLYGDRLRAYADEGVLSGLYVAFSRKDSREKRYVQHDLREHRAKVVALLRDPRLHYYVCGDAAMAEQVEQTLLRLLTDDGMDRTAAFLHLEAMKDQRRFQTDVWGVTYSSLAQVKEDKAHMAGRWAESLDGKGEGAAPAPAPEAIVVRMLQTHTGSSEEHARRALQSSEGNVARALQILSAFELA
ncbi:MAG TPA: nitric oxide synthase oxygenase [Polyangiaceae bacterium]|nr:nitric oxide synthase oxygenase [Polyangiaceae bacterium]